ncbi:hypothetical protein [Streptomyces cellostaticus]|uniref:hypothetical protein n=1 Tax=Streptomyces cellostaticus TaxID=67285 RepID=UPI001FC9094C|nr:hypothetical protein [Streptomyces cellostaticus]GHI04579.1 hypothetical protein Scel_29000 [Streptomyces cellostaticus]
MALVAARLHDRPVGHALVMGTAGSEGGPGKRAGSNAGTAPRSDPYHHAPLSADAAEIRDLKNPKAALGWNQQAAAMPTGVFTRSVGMRLAIVRTAHLQSSDLDHGLELGNRSVDILARIKCTRAKDYVRDFNAALAPWRREPAVREFIHRTRKELGIGCAAVTCDVGWREYRSP